MNLGPNPFRIRPTLSRRRTFAVAASFALMLAMLPSAVSAATLGLAQRDLEAQALSSLSDGYRRLIDPADPTALKLVGNVAEGGVTQTVAERIARIDARRLGNAYYGLHFKTASVSLKDVTVERRGAQVVLRATEEVWLTYIVSHRDSLPDDVMAEAIPHEFIFDSVDGRWTLVFDRTLWPRAGQPQSDPDAPTIDPARALTHERPGRGSGGRPTAPRPVFAWGTFDKTAAVNYATTWWNGWNQFYPHYGDDDCTNFMSQAKAAGGWTAKGGHYLDQNAWWYDGSNKSHSNTWSVANWLLGFSTGSGRSYYLGTFTDFEVGDFMYADWYWKNGGVSNTPEHAMIVSRKLSNNYADIQFTYHSVNRLHKPLSDIISENPNSVYWGTRVPYTSN